MGLYRIVVGCHPSCAFWRFCVSFWIACEVVRRDLHSGGEPGLGFSGGVHVDRMRVLVEIGHCM